MDNPNPILKEDLPDYRDPSLEYTLVSIESVATGIGDEFDVYMRTGGGYFLIKPRNSPVAPHVIQGLKKKNPYLYLRNSDREAYFKKLDQQLAHALKKEGLSATEKASLITDYAVEIVDKLFCDPGNPQTIQNAQTLSNYCADFIGSHKHAFLHLVELSSHDQYTYAHSVGVASYSLALGRNLGYTREQLSNIGLAGLLHDLGKCKVDPAIINKKAPLNPEEWKVMKKHPEYGAEILKRHKLPAIISLAAEAHHENLMGTGYPKGVLAQELDPIVGVVSLADAFSALTTKRSYSQARDSMSALMLMKDNLGTKFDQELFKRFVTLFLDPVKKAA